MMSAAGNVSLPWRVARRPCPAGRRPAPRGVADRTIGLVASPAGCGTLHRPSNNNSEGAPTMSIVRSGSRFCVRAAAVIAALCCGAPAANAEMFGGVDFPQGAISFADAVVGYAPGMVGTDPTAPHREPANALGAPNYTGVN